MKRRLRVLCVDDSADDAELNLVALRRYGYDVDSSRVERAQDAAQALRDPWDVILCDYSMPHFSAPKLLELLALDEGDIPCLIVSGAVGEEAAAETIRLGAYDYVFKNNLKRLGPAVERAIRDADIRRARRAMEEQLRTREMRLRMLFEQLPALVVTTDLDLRITSVEGARLDALGMNPDVLMGTRIGTSALIADESRFLVRRSHLRAAQGIPGEYEMIWGGKTLQGHVEPLRDTDGHTVGTIGVAFDVTERRVAEQRLAYFSQYDVLTDLPNRTVLEDRATQAIALGCRHDERVALIAVDLDRFKEINETYGRSGGDELLRTVGSRLRRIFDPSSTISRVGEDSFMILLPAVLDRESLETAARRVIDAFDSPFSIGSTDAYVTASMGLAIFGDDATDALGMIEAAEAALLVAKQSGRNTWRFFAPTMLASSAERISLKRELRNAPAAGQLVLYYQPMLKSHDRSFAGLEALVRWQHPSLGLLAPDNFVPLAEESGSIEGLGEWVLDEACRQLSLWRAQGFEVPRMSINISVRQFERNDMRNVVKHILERYSIDPACIELELTESAIMRDVTGAIAILHDLKTLGVRIAVDDFGAGYTSLGFLRRFPIDTLKIDQSFIRDLSPHSHDEAIVRAIVTLSSNLGLTSIAEGVEQESTFLHLQAIGVDVVQGFWVAQPVPPESVVEMVRNVVPGSSA
ncbi:MAG: putative bifunctional diguanylate cyclase/phosphodiesterase [Vulcanimicrobiaceae bacterium]